MKVLTIGGATCDIYLGYTARQAKTVGKQPYIVLPEGQKLELASVEYYAGGGATNSATSFARLGCVAGSFFKIGTDVYGTMILQLLKKERIAVHPSISSEDKTGSSFILGSSSGDNTLLVYRGANASIGVAEVPFNLIVEHDVLYITSLSGESAEILPEIARYAFEHNKIVAVNPGGSQLNEGMKSLSHALPFVDIFILNWHEAQLCMNALTQSEQAFDVKQFIKIIFDLGPSVVVVTDGSRGVYVGHENRLIFHKTAPVEVVGTVGAGDAFGSAFVAQYVGGVPIEDAVRAGMINSASVISYIDAKTGLLDAQSLEKKLKSWDLSLLEYHSLD